jgi:hypothetical protein
VGVEASHAVDGVGVAAQQWPQQRSDVCRVVLEVGVEDGRVRPAGVLERGRDGRALAAVAIVQDEPFYDPAGERLKS